MTKKEKEIKMYWADMTRQVVKAAESDDTYKLESLAKEMAIYAKIEGISVPISIEKKLKEAKVELPVLSKFSREKYSILPWVKKRQKEEFKSRIEFGLELKEMHVLSEIEDEYKKELVRLANRDYKVDNKRLKQIIDRYEAVKKELKERYKKEMVKLPNFMFKDCPEKWRERKKWVAEALEVFNAREDIFKLLDSPYPIKLSEQDTIKWEEAADAAKEQGKPHLEKFLRDAIDKHGTQLKEQKANAEAGSKRGKEIKAEEAAKARDNAYQAEKRRNEKAERDREEREAAIQRSANRDNGMPYGSW